MYKKIPQHIAIIMDGNRRWAKKKNLSVSKGHRKGVDALKGIVQYSGKVGIKYLTVYAFSTENWFRKKVEIVALIKILANALKREVQELNQNNVRLKFIGNIKEFPSNLQKKIKESEEKLKKNTGLNLLVALNYGGRAEIIEAAKKAKNLNEKNIQENLYTKNVPDPELIIRTGGVFRLSNFLLWQAAYSELYFTEVLWPDFKESHLDKAILDYNKRERRFGK